MDTGTLAPVFDQDDAEANEDHEADATTDSSSDDDCLSLSNGYRAIPDEDITVFVTIEGNGHEATFRVVDRDGSLAVRPTDAGYRTSDAPVDWYVSAANALERALPERYAAFDARENPWTTGGTRTT